VEVKTASAGSAKDLHQQTSMGTAVVGTLPLLLQLSCHNICHVCGRNCNHTSHVRVSSS